MGRDNTIILTIINLLMTDGSTTYFVWFNMIDPTIYWPGPLNYRTDLINYWPNLWFYLTFQKIFIFVHNLLKTQKFLLILDRFNKTWFCWPDCDNLLTRLGMSIYWLNIWSIKIFSKLKSMGYLVFFMNIEQNFVWFNMIEPIIYWPDPLNYWIDLIN